MKDEFDFDEDEQIDMFCFMDESEREKLIYEDDAELEIELKSETQQKTEKTDVVSTSALVLHTAFTLLDTVNPLCLTCENCQYKSVTEHTKELCCIMFGCNIHRD
ncbi:MAG: hypothetical protein PHE02_15135, partial [Lachnospiraceae bacterium]|nr:hypothetical protein [Lachnospiraceae bacterium]